MKLGMFQPQRIGDIVICLPIAKYYHDKGYEIIWPINKEFLSHFQNTVDYVTFTEFKSYSEFVTKYSCNFVLDLCFNVYGNEIHTSLYNNQTQFTFDELKYKIANVPFEEKWKLQIKRNMDREMALYNSLVKMDKYVLCQTRSSSHNISKHIEVGTEYQKIQIEPLTDCIFDWLTLIENSSGVCLIESCFTNLIDQLHISIDKKYCIMKHGYYGKKLDNRQEHHGIPILKNGWNFI